MNDALGLLTAAMVDWYLSQNSYYTEFIKHRSNTQKIKINQF